MRRFLFLRSVDNQGGYILIVCLLVVAALLLLGTTAVLQTSTDLKISSNYRGAVQAFYAAEGGVEYGIAKLKQALQFLTPNLDISSPSLSGFTFTEFSITQGASSSEETLSSGPYAGLTSYCRDYTITSGVRGGENSAAKVVAVVKDILIPLFQFGIFYEEDLEILPGADMTFAGGRIHSNGNIYLNPDGSTLSIDSLVTTAGNMYRRRKGSTGSDGTVRIKDSDGQYQDMTIDSDGANWQTESQSTWDGRVKSQVHGVPELELPMDTSNPRDILGTGSGSLYAKSGLRIIDGVAKDKDGNVVDLTYTDPSDPSVTINPISTATFYDQREDATVTVTEVDMDALMGNSTAMAKLADPPDGGDAGVLYVSSSTDSIRLTDGATLPSSGLTVASDRPVYIQGNYNNVSNSPAAVIADAVTVLSGAWVDANSYSANLSDRTASDTTVNAAIMGGNKNTSGSQYSGGVENFIRFLEGWSGKTLSYTGSLVCLWESQYATGNWSYGSPVYTAPTRNWSYGVSSGSLPPGTPRVRTLQIKSWQQVF